MVSICLERCGELLIPEPKFQLGQKLFHVWICDDELDEGFGRFFLRVGYVVGFLWDNPVKLLGRFQWSYFLSFDNDCSYLGDELLTESEFKLRYPDLEALTKKSIQQAPPL